MMQWGKVVLSLDNPLFADGYKRGREMYHRDCRLVPLRASQIRISGVLRYVLVPDGTGGYRLDIVALDKPEAYMGFLVGYLSAAIPIE
ncbi:MAG: hypothetical protein ACXWOL_09005 [Ktedonobacteraceae bacterium]